MVDDNHFLVHFESAVVHLAHTDAAYVFVVVNGTDQYLGACFGISGRCRDVL